MEKKYDFIVIGGGTVGFDGINEAKANGAERILMIEKDKVGGTCLNWG
jgi:pyruvate/2-oxoglutarate dehydrogenase complex dihydrolipoamide dehydrogenase (E3) component